VSEYPADDPEFEEHVLTAVVACAAGGWTITYDTATSFFCPAQAPVEPRPSMVARFYGRGFGSIVRGLFLDGRRVFYRTAAEEESRHRAWVLDREAQQKAQFEGDRAAYEGYELFVCEEAVKLIDALKMAEAVIAFQALCWNEQIARVPTMSGEHSGNTFGMACLLAHEFLVHPERVKRWYGALAPLVGSQEYGCVPRPKEDADASA
jgi:hypothetical protein